MKQTKPNKMTVEKTIKFLQTNLSKLNKADIIFVFPDQSVHLCTPKKSINFLYCYPSTMNLKLISHWIPNTILIYTNQTK